MNKMTERDYPLSEKHPELVKAMSGTSAEDLTLEKVLAGEIRMEDGRISKEVLLAQAEIAESGGNHQMALNLTRAAEMTLIPDELILQVYNAIRPGRSRKEEILALADLLQQDYRAEITADFVREAADALEKMDGLLK